MAAILRHVMLLQRDVPKAATFYSEGLGLRLVSFAIEGLGTNVAGSFPGFKRRTVARS